MLNTSKDVLYLVLAFCIIWITVFLCWLMYYFISIIGGVRKIVKSVEDKMQKIDRLMDLLKEKIENSASYLGLVVEGVAKIVNYMKQQKYSDNNEEKETEQPKRKFSKKVKLADEE